VTPLIRFPGLSRIQRHRPTKWAKYTDVNNIRAELTFAGKHENGKCCNDTCLITHKYSIFTVEQIRLARVSLCQKNEQEVTVCMAIQMDSMYNRETKHIDYRIQSHRVCRVAFALYYGLRKRKLDTARAMAQGFFSFLSMPSLLPCSRLHQRELNLLIAIGSMFVLL
jgi:hypothetical protein